MNRFLQVHHPYDTTKTAFCLSQCLADEANTLAFARQLAPVLQNGLVIFLVGDLGAGKTTLVRALLQALGVTGRIKSPTYSLVEIYMLQNNPIYHFDLYRLSSPLEWEDAGFREFVHGQSMVLIEWPEKALPCLPAPDCLIQLQYDASGEGRAVQLFACSEKGWASLQKIT